MRRRSIRTWLAFGTAVAVLGGGLLAVTSDSITSDGNRAESDVFDGVGGSPDIQAAVVADSSLCNDVDLTDADFGDGPLPAVLSGVMDLDDAEPTIVGSVVCFRNVGTGNGDVRVLYTDILYTEVGPCAASEIEAGDTTCADGDEGEFSIEPSAASDGCTLSGPNSDEFSLAAGEYCDYRLSAVPNLFVQPAAAQTDAVTFDVTWTLDGVTTCTDPGADERVDAQPVVLGVVTSSTACDDDWYVLHASEFTPGEELRVDLTFLHADADLDLYVLADAGGTLGIADSATDNESVTFNAPASGDVILRVLHYAGGVAPYDLVVSRTAAP